jgi:hypothetical protein
MGPWTRGDAPGYDVSPLRGDPSAPSTSSAAEQPHRVKHMASPRGNRPVPNSHAPKGHSMSAQGEALGPGHVPLTPKAP